jgi:hypothetical protein
MLQLFGEKKKSELFPLKKPANDGENSDRNEEKKSEDEDVDVYTTTDSDLGKINSILVKYDDKAENENETKLNFVEIIDPKGDVYT